MKCLSRKGTGGEEYTKLITNHTPLLKSQDFQMKEIYFLHPLKVLKCWSDVIFVCRKSRKKIVKMALSWFKIVSWLMLWKIVIFNNDAF